MSLTPLEADLAVHQKLSDEPNDVGGLSAQELKEKFDQAGLVIQEYLNETHLPQVEEALAQGLAQAKTYADNKLAAIGAGDMATAVYDTQNRRRDVYQFAHDEAVRVLGSATRFGYVAMGSIRGSASVSGNSAVPVRFDTVTDPRGLWSDERSGFLIPAGASQFGATVQVRWARQSFADAYVRLVVDGEVRAQAEGPADSSGSFSLQTVMLGCPVEPGELVQVVLAVKSGPAIQGQTQAQAQVDGKCLRAEILM